MHVGVVGTGLMGSALVRRLRAGGHDVTLWNREPEALPPLLALGAVAAPSPRAVAEAAELVLLCVLNTDAVHDCVFAPEGVAAAQRSGPPGLLVDLSTIDPDSTRAFAVRLQAETGAGWVDAPMSGGPPAAEAGRLTIMAGGNLADMARAAPVLALIASNVTHMGPVGAGQVTKLVNQALVGAGFTLLAEALAMAEAAGIDAARLPACLAGGFADSTLLSQVFPAMQARQFEPKLGYARQLDKDMKAVQHFAQSLGLDLPVVTKAANQFAAFVAAGHGMDDSRAIGRLYGL
jgi:3-hydroxyisobutyrate dehydrogenase